MSMYEFHLPIDHLEFQEDTFTNLRHEAIQDSVLPTNSFHCESHGKQQILVYLLA